MLASPSETGGLRGHQCLLSRSSRELRVISVSPGQIGTSDKMLSRWGFTLCFEELADSGLSL
jgi:hypothetical protein